MHNLRAVYPLGDNMEMHCVVSGLKDYAMKEVFYRMKMEGCEKPTLEQVLRWGEHAATRQGTSTLHKPVTAPKAPIVALTCFVCEKKDHPAFRCSLKKKQGCYRCGSTSHVIKECPEVQPLKERLLKKFPALTTIIDHSLAWQEETTTVCSSSEEESEPEQQGQDETTPTHVPDEEEPQVDQGAVSASVQRWQVGCGAWARREGMKGARLLRYVVETKGGRIGVLVVDPGSELSLINQATARRKGIQTKKLQGEAPKVITAGGQMTGITEWVPKLEFWKGGWKEEMAVIVMPQLIAPIVLGMDWMVRRVPVVDWGVGRG